jgi:hypothetical protein
MVRELQRHLARAGYNPQGIDGLFGPRTEQALRRFQAQHRLRVDGIAHPDTFISQHSRRQRRPHPPNQRRTKHHSTTHHPATAPQRPTHAPAPMTARPTGRPSGSTPASWLWLLAAVLGLALLLTVAGHTRRRRAAPPGFSSKLPDGGAEPAAAVGERNGAVAGSHNGHVQHAREHPTQGGADARTAFRLAVLLEEQNDLAGAEAAYRRADGQGHAAAASNLGVLLELRGDLEAAEAAYRRADERGDPNGAFNLAVLLEEQNDLAGAEAAYCRADQRGAAEVANAARAALVSLREGPNGTHDPNGGDFDAE